MRQLRHSQRTFLLCGIPRKPLSPTCLPPERTGNRARYGRMAFSAIPPIGHGIQHIGRFALLLGVRQAVKDRRFLNETDRPRLQGLQEIQPLARLRRKPAPPFNRMIRQSGIAQIRQEARKLPISPCPARRRRPPKCRRNQDGGFQRRGQCKRNRPFSAGRGVRSMPSTSHRAAPSCRAFTAKPFFSPKRLTFPQTAAIHRQRHQAVFRSPDSGSAPPLPGTPAPAIQSAPHMNRPRADRLRHAFPSRTALAELWQTPGELSSGPVRHPPCGPAQSGAHLSCRGAERACSLPRQFLEIVLNKQDSLSAIKDYSLFMEQEHGIRAKTFFDFSSLRGFFLSNRMFSKLFSPFLSAYNFFDSFFLLPPRNFNPAFSQIIRRFGACLP